MPGLIVRVADADLAGHHVSLARDERHILPQVAIEPPEIVLLERAVVPDAVAGVIETAAPRIAALIPVVHIREQRRVEEVGLRGEARCLDIREQRFDRREVLVTSGADRRLQVADRRAGPQP
jgi:hypothetical protein